MVRITVANDHEAPKTGMKITEHTKLSEFITHEMIAVVALPIGADEIHTAALHYYHEVEPFKFYFVTGRETEKLKLLLKSPTLKGGCVIGTYKKCDFTLQMRGIFEILDAKSHQSSVEAYLKKYSNKADDPYDPDNAFLCFTPAWARFTDYSIGYDHFYLDL